MKLTIQQLANLCMHSWEVEREFGFYLDPIKFREHIAQLQHSDLRVILESLGLLFRTVREIGACEVELKADGQHSLWTPLARTQTAKASGADENIRSPEPEVQGGLPS